MIDALIVNSLKAENVTWLEKLPMKMIDRLTSEAIVWILKYTKKYEHPPTIERYMASPHATIASGSFPKVPLEDLYDQSIQMLKREHSASKLNEWRYKIDDGEELTQSELAEFMKTLMIPTSKEDVDMSRSGGWGWDDRAVEKHKFGITTLDEIVGGFKKGSYGVVAARPGIGKTQLLCHFAVNWYLEGKKVLFVSCEMSLPSIMARVHGIMSKNNPSLFFDGKTKARDDAIEFIQMLDDMAASKGGLLGLVKPPATTDTVRRLADKWMFDFIVVDSFYRLRDKSITDTDWNRVKLLSDSLTQIIADYECSVFTTSQLKRTGKTSGFTLEDLAFSDAIGQDIDVGLAMYNVGRDAQVVEIIKNRNGNSVGNISVSYDWTKSEIVETSWS